MGQTFDKHFKQEAVRLVQTSGKSQRQVAEDLGVAMSTLSQRSYGDGNARERERSWEAETNNPKPKSCAV
jgi:transposase